MNTALVKYVLGGLALAWAVSQSAPSFEKKSDTGTFIEKVGKVEIYKVAGNSEDGKSRDGITLRWRGKISENMGQQMVSALKKYRRETDRFVIDISSSGGFVHSGETLIDYMKRLKLTHTIATRVPDRGQCLSMCVPIFLNGDERHAGATAAFMFHRPWVEEQKFGSSMKQQAEKRRYKARLNSKLSQAAWRFYNVHFNHSPIDRDWLKKLEENWKVRGKDYWTNGEKLVTEQSNVVTHLL